MDQVPNPSTARAVVLLVFGSVGLLYLAIRRSRVARIRDAERGYER